MVILSEFNSNWMQFSKTPAGSTTLIYMLYPIPIFVLCDTVCATYCEAFVMPCVRDDILLRNSAIGGVYSQSECFISVTTAHTRLSSLLAWYNVREGHAN